MLTGAQIAHFQTFGFLLLRQVFSVEEMQAMAREADDVWREDRGGRPDQGEHQWLAWFLERRPLLARLAEDDRIYTSIEQVLGPGFIWCGSEGQKGSFNAQGEHPWHSDSPRARDLDFTRIKVILYLQPTRKETGALRVIPGSHRRPLYNDLDPLNEQLETSCQDAFGVAGVELPCFPLEAGPGDAVFFNQRLYHAVYGKQPGRRYIALKYANPPATDEQIAALRHASVFEVHEAYLHSDRPRIRGMIAPLVALGGIIEKQ